MSTGHLDAHFACAEGPAELTDFNDKPLHAELPTPVCFDQAIVVNAAKP